MLTVCRQPRLQPKSQGSPLEVPGMGSVDPRVRGGQKQRPKLVFLGAIGGNTLAF